MLFSKNKLKYAEFYKNKSSHINFISHSLKIYVKKSENKNPRFCIVVPKKLDKRTVKRNQTKRSLYKFISLNIKKFESNIDVLIIVKKIIQKIDEGKLVEDLKKFIYEYKSFKNN